MKTYKRLIQSILIILCLLSFTATIFLSTRYVQYKRKALETIQIDAQKETYAAAKKIGEFVTTLAPLVNNLARKLSEKTLSKKEIIELLRKKPVTISGFGVSFAPQVLDSPDSRYAPYYAEKNGTQELSQLELEIDYTKPECHWYHLPFKKGAQFLEAPSWNLAEHILIGFAAPFYKRNTEKKQIPAGVVFATQTAEHIKHMLTTIYLGKKGYCFILSHDCKILVHPFDKYSQEQNKLQEIMNSSQEPALHTLAQQVASRKAGVIEYQNEINGHHSRLFFEPIPSTSWVLCHVFPYDEIPFDKNQSRQTIMLLSLALLTLFTCLMLLIASFIKLNTVRLWITSFVVSALLLFELVALWYIIWHMPPYKKDLIPINDKVGLYAFLDTIAHKRATYDKEYLQKHTAHETKKVSTEARHEPKLSENIQRILHYRYKQHGYIPTGIYIQHMKFITENQLEMTAYIWQRYFDTIHDEISRGFVLPQAAVTKIAEVYHTKEHDTETIIWQVRATINQRILYVKYPFDIKDIQIQISHKDFNQKIILVPDLASYKIIHPTALPGLSKEVYLPGWFIANSYFGYKITDYDTAFGLYSYGPLGIYKQIEKCNQPELYYNITAQRFLLNTLVADLLPLAIIAFLLFVILVSSTVQGYAVLGSCASVFFGAIIAQSRFRGKIESYNLIYFETFYLVMYGTILAIVLVSLLYMLKEKIPIIHYKQNLIAKLLYWPAILGILLIITFRYFY